jgi:2-polyprenyl-6-methoxyphenol hydroxylase-like FAD-dependent oxidoreductase
MSAEGKTKRIVIIGAGIAGLSLALALNLLNKSNNKWEIYIFEAKPAFDDQGHIILWKQGIRGLMELGLGGRLGRVAEPLPKLVSRDVTTNEVIVKWPKDDAVGDVADADIPAMYVIITKGGS